MKRPLVWALAFYLAGLTVYSFKSIVIVLITIILILFGAFWLLIRNDIKELKISSFKKFYYIFLFPGLLLFGYLLLNRQLMPNDMDTAFQTEAEGNVIGKLSAIADKGDYTILTLKKAEIKIDAAKIYYNNTVNVYLYSNTYESSNININTTEKMVNTEYDNAVESIRNTKYDNTVESKSNTYSKSNSYKIGNTISVNGTIKKFQKASNPGQFNEYQYYKMLGIDYKMNADSFKIINSSYSGFLQTLFKIKLKLMNVYKDILPVKNAGILNAMILGDMAGLDSEIKELYQENGISHILAISGVHITLLGLTLYELLRRTKIPLIMTAAISVFFIFSYGILTNFSVSTNRAVVMLIVLIGANLLGRTYDILSATALSALIILIQSPLQAFNAGFLLSFGAILGISVIYPLISSLFTFKNKIIDGFIVSFSIQLITLPVILIYFFEFPTYSILINMIILPTSSLIILLAILAGVAGCIFLPLGEVMIGGVHYILNFYELICRIGKELPGRSFLVGKPDILVILAYFSVLTIFVAVNSKKKRRISIILLSFLIIILFKPRIVALEVTFMDVGQGDGIFMQSQSGTAYLIDGGSSDVNKVGQYRIQNFLKSKGVGKIDYAIMTHADSDHISGLKELIEGISQPDYRIPILNDIFKDTYNGSIQIEHLILPAVSTKDEAYQELENMAKAKGISVLYIQKGDAIEDGKLTLTCLHPNSDYTFTSRNAYSTVLSVRLEDFNMLLTGDLEEDGEELLVDALKNMASSDYDVLKVAHHGSRYSSYEDFLNIVKPEYSIISCGFDNSYGHPHAELIQRLEKAESKIFITYESGAVTIKTDGRKMEVKEYLKDQ